MIGDSQPGQLQKAATCEHCGSFGVLEIAGQNLCPDCIATAGCGCAGHDNNED